ncbi:hypothetical protein AgCh_024510 [Apium graveolens]
MKGDVKFGDGSLVKIEGKGSIKIVCKNGEIRVLQGVYYIPTLRSNIISLGQLSEEENQVVMNGENLWVMTAAKTPTVHAKKLDDQSHMVVHFGREPGIKAYHLFDPLTRRIHVSRDVVFNERKAWDWDSNTDSELRRDGYFILGDYTPDIMTQEDDFDMERDESVSPETSSMHMEQDESVSPATPPTPQPSVSVATTSQNGSEDITLSSASSVSSEHPQRFQNLADIYANTTEIEVEEELLLMGVDEPIYFKQAITDTVWKEAMDHEINSIEKNNT